ncbi:MAG: hypothetical protein JWL83_4554, partial [Actinomycetia bacterium]|nr:hypothetical protein [Actinomycetes bacterium]
SSSRVRRRSSGMCSARASDAVPQLPDDLGDVKRQTSAFVATASHELRTPLANILGYVEVLQDLDAGPLEPEQLRLLGIVERNGKRLLRLIENFLTVFDVDGGTFVIQRAPFDVGELVSRVQHNVAAKVAGGRLELHVNIEADLPSVLGDAEQLERALSDIIENAIKFTPEGGRIVVRVSLIRDDNVRFEVADSGVGVPPAETDRLFQPLFRSSLSQAGATEGMGLGLHIVKMIIEGHGGEVGASSVLDEGTVVWFTIPAGLAAKAAA